MDALNAEFGGTLRGPEFQAVLIIDYDDGRMFPLTEDCPKCLLPVGNRRLLSYQLDVLSKSGIAEVYIVAPREYEVKVSHFLGEYIQEGMSIDLAVVDDMSGSADCLRAIGDRIRGDFVCLHSDFISQFCLGDLATLHRLNSSDLTMMFTAISKDAKRDEMDEEFIGICDDGRVVLKMPTLEIDESIKLSKPLLHHAPTLSLRQDLFDLGVYVMSHWVIEFCLMNKRISSVRTDLVPYLINRQYQPAEYLVKLIPALAHRNLPLKTVDPWVSYSCTGSAGSRAGTEDRPQVILDELIRTAAATKSVPPSPKPSLDKLCLASGDLNTSAMSPTAPESALLLRSSDPLRCFALVYDTVTPVSASAIAAGTPPAAGPLLNRIVNITTYINMNKDIVALKHSPRIPWPRLQNVMKKEMSIMGEGCEVAEKTVTIKQCCIGNNCKIGQMSKLNNCVIMGDVVIGENCTVQNSILCDKVVIENNCKINDCNIGGGYRVVVGSRLKSETFTASSH